MSTVRTDNVAPSAGGTSRNLPRGVAAAWLTLTGTGTATIRDSQNVSSVTDNGTGDYSENITSALNGTGYSFSWGYISDLSSLSSGSPSPRYMIAITQTASLLRVLTGTSPSGVIDFPTMAGNQFGSLA